MKYSPTKVRKSSSVIQDTKSLMWTAKEIENSVSFFTEKNN